MVRLNMAVRQALELRVIDGADRNEDGTPIYIINILGSLDVKDIL
jgi:hypothetical protein